MASKVVFKGERSVSVSGIAIETIVYHYYLDEYSACLKCEHEGILEEIIGIKTLEEAHQALDDLKY